MKGNAKPASIYFSAYPLKAIEQAAASSIEAPQSPFLRAIHSGKTKAKLRTNVFPMINPYQERHAQPQVNNGLYRMISRSRNHVPDDIELTEKRWFHNYE